MVLAPQLLPGTVIIGIAKGVYVMSVMSMVMVIQWMMTNSGAPALILLATEVSNEVYFWLSS